MEALIHFTQGVKGAKPVVEVFIESLDSSQLELLVWLAPLPGFKVSRTLAYSIAADMEQKKKGGCNLHSAYAALILMIMRSDSTEELRELCTTSDNGVVKSV